MRSTAMPMARLSRRSRNILTTALAGAFLGMVGCSAKRITADPASMSVIRYTKLRPFVLHVNHTGARLASVLTAPPPDVPGSGGDAVVGGSTD